MSPPVSTPCTAIAPTVNSDRAKASLIGLARRKRETSDSDARRNHQRIRKYISRKTKRLTRRAGIGTVLFRFSKINRPNDASGECQDPAESLGESSARAR